MALKLILGGSGQGKTEYLMEEVIRESQRNPSQQYYVIVPEQFSLEMQRLMVQKHEKHGFSNIDILSFYRLAYRVFDECGYQPKEILEDLGVSMILKKILLEHSEDLVYFQRSMKHPGFLDELKSMLMEFMNYGVSASDVQAVSEDLDRYPGLREKCRELSLIFQWFSQRIRDQYMVAGQILEVLKDMVPDSSMLKEGIFYMDGFTGFTPIQLDFLRELLTQARNVTVTVTIPYIPVNGKYKGEDLFSFSEKTVASLVGLCRDTAVEVLEPVLIQKEQAVRYGEHTQLSHLERNIFRVHPQKYEGEVTQIHAVTCKSPEDEAEYVLHKIEEIVRSKGYRYRDFAILMGNEEDYPSAFLRKSQNLSIPLFVDSSQKMAYHCGVETIRALFYLVRMDYSYESVFRYLKSGMSDFQGDEADYLENYVFSSGVRGFSMWSKAFYRKLSGLSDDKIQYLEQLRLRFLEETQEFTVAMKKKESTVLEKMTILYDTLIRLRFPEKLANKAQEAEENADFVKARAYEQFFGEFLNLMDKIVAIFGEEVMEIRDLSELIDAGLETIALSAPPLSMDQAILGDLKRTRLPRIKVLFFVGVNDGDIPPVPEDQGILCDEEKRILDEHGITLSLNLTERVLEDEYYMYLAFSSPQEALYLSCCQTAADGSAKRPSPLFQRLEKIFPGLRILQYPDQIRRLYFGEKDSLEYLISGLRRWHDGEKPEDPAFYALLSYWENTHPKELSEIWQHMSLEASWAPLSTEVVDALYGKEIVGSVTRLEQFAACPYHYFLSFGLELMERQEYKIYPFDIGNIFHKALEHFSRQIKEEGYHWKEIPEEVKERLLHEAVNVALGDDISDVLESSARNRYKKKMVSRILKKTVEVLSHHLRNSSFEPDQFELYFSPNDALEATKIRLSDGHRMALKGVIDRVDICEEDDHLYLKIIDYKTGNKTFDFNELYYGLQIQLIVYLNAAIEYYAKQKQKTVEPAGVFYYHVQDPIQKEESISASNPLKVYQMSGYANDDPKILDLLEHSDGKFESVEVSITRQGIPSKTSKVMRTEDFYRIGDYVKDSMRRTGEEIYSGKIEASPYKLGTSTGCDYCPYISVCGFENGANGQKYHILPKFNAKDILEKIEEEVD